MPKKFSTENPRAAMARQRKTEAAEGAKQREEARLENELWADDDKNASRKKQREGEREEKQLQKQQSKLEAQKLLQMEEEQLMGSRVGKHSHSAKLTRSDIEMNRMELAQKPVSQMQKNLIVSRLINLENLNISEAEVLSARTVDQALDVLSEAGVVSADGTDKHPQKRMKSALALFEEENMSRLREENPTLKLSQVKQLLWKEWVKSAKNPLNK